jgi:thioredoxin 1
MVVKELGSVDAWKTAISVKDRLVVLDCYADWCGPCKMISPVLEK